MDNDTASAGSPELPPSPMAAATQKRWLTQPKSKLAKSDLPAVLRNEEAWSSFGRETRQKLYDMLPPPRKGEPAHNVDVHPLQTAYKDYIVEAIRTFQNDLIDGREVKTWRDQAMMAEQERRGGKWEEYRAWRREDDWGDDEEEDELTGDDDEHGDASDGEGPKGDAIQSIESEEGELAVQEPMLPTTTKKASKSKTPQSEGSETQLTPGNRHTPKKSASKSKTPDSSGKKVGKKTTSADGNTDSDAPA